MTQCFVDAELVSLAKSVQQKTDNSNKDDDDDEVLAMPLLLLESNPQEDVDEDTAADQLLKCKVIHLHVQPYKR